MVELFLRKQSTIYTFEIIVAIVSFMILSARVEPIPTTFVYVPGLFGSPIVGGRYCSRLHYRPTGEIIYGTRGGELFGDGSCVSAVVCCEIDVKKPQDWFRRTIAPSIARSIFMKKFGIAVRENPAGIDTIFNYIFDPRKANIGQYGDVEAMRLIYAEHCMLYPDTQVVLFGDSRGAATVFNFVALDQPDVAACVCEGIFDSIPHLIKHIYRWSSKGDWIEQLLQKTLRFCSKCYDPAGPFPIMFVDRFPRTVPLLLITSEEDMIVPRECTVALYSALQQRGYDRVHLLILPHSAHDSYMVGPDREIYEACVHAFYKTYGIAAYDPVKAAQGESIFAQTQPTAHELHARYKLTKRCCIDAASTISPSSLKSSP